LKVPAPRHPRPPGRVSHIHFELLAHGSSAIVGRLRFRLAQFPAPAGRADTSASVCSVMAQAPSPGVFAFGLHNSPHQRAAQITSASVCSVMAHAPSSGVLAS
jgi:hypothetical protein